MCYWKLKSMLLYKEGNRSFYTTYKLNSLRNKQAFKTLRADSCTSDIVVGLISLIKVKNLIFQSKYDNTFWFLQLGWASAQPGLSKCQLFSIATERNITNFCRVTTCSFMYKKSPWLDFLWNFCLTCNPQEWQQYLMYMN